MNAEAAANLCAPTGLQAVGGDVFDDARLAPDGITTRAEPLRPVIGASAVGGAYQEEGERAQAKEGESSHR